MKMKKMAGVWSIVLALLTLIACEKTDIIPAEPAESANSAEIAAAKKGGGGGGGTAVTTFGGQSTGVNATVVNTSNFEVTSYQTILAQTGLLPATGGSLEASATQASIPGVLSADALTASTASQNGGTISTASATNLNLTIGGNVITASTVRSSASANCGGVSGISSVDNLVVNGTPINITGQANQVVYLPGGGMLVINEQSTPRKGRSGSITVTGLHIILPNGSNVWIAMSKAEIKC